MKKTTIISLVSIICLTLLITCTSFDPAMFQKKPTIQFHSFQFKEITLNDMTTLFSIEIENPYPITLYVDSMQSQIYIDSHSLLVLQSTDSLKLPKHSKTIKTFAATIPYQQLLQAANNYINRDSIMLSIKGTIGFSLPPSIQIVKPINVPFTIKQEIPTIKPSIDIAHFKIIPPTLNELATLVKNRTLTISMLELNKVFSDIQAFSQGKSIPDSILQLDIPLSMSFDIIIKNKTKALLTGKSIDYNFILHDTEIAKGKPTIQSVKGISTINCLTVLSTKNLSKGIVAALPKKNIHYVMKGSMVLDASFKGSTMPIPFSINHDGTISW